MSGERPKLAGVMGWPVSHSLSPRLHTHWLTRLGIGGAYLPLEVPPEKVEEAFRILPYMGFRGWNVTVPHKEKAFALIENKSGAAKAIGAVNTVVVREDGTLYGDNTDAYGFMENLRSQAGGQTRWNRALVLGAGGAARAVIYGLKESGVREIILLNRSPDRAEALAKEFSVRALPWEKRSEAMENIDLLVNTTTLGMSGQPKLELDLSRLPASATVADIVYNPRETPLLEQARARGNRIVTGLGMLIHQAVPGFEAWFGVRPEVTEELEEVLK